MRSACSACAPTRGYKPVGKLIDTHTYRGLWWLPSAPDDKHEGTLTIKKADARLDLLGHFGRELISEPERERVYSLWLADQERVVGLTTDGKQVTLVDCTQGSGGGIHFPGIENGVYRARAVIVGHTFDGTVPITFDEVEFRTSDLETWVGIVPFPVTLNAARDGGTFTFARPPVMEFPLASGETATLRFEMHAASTPGSFCSTSSKSATAPRRCSADGLLTRISTSRCSASTSGRSTTRAATASNASSPTRSQSRRTTGSRGRMRKSATRRNTRR